MRRRSFLGCMALPGCAVQAMAEVARADGPGALAAGVDAEPETEAVLGQGRAIWYGGRRWHGRRTASGERFDRHALTAAHPSLPMGSWLRVVNLDNGREVHVRINDRGPKGQRYIIDLSEAAAERLGFRRKGTAQVQLQRIATPQGPLAHPADR